MPVFICPNCRTRSVDIDRYEGFTTNSPQCRNCGFGFLFQLLEDYYPAPSTGFVVCDREARVLAVGRGVFELTGYREADLIGRDVAAALSLSDRGPLELVREYLGRPKFFAEIAERIDRPGVATGLVVTPVGGDIVFVEANVVPGKKELRITGQLGGTLDHPAMFVSMNVLGSMVLDIDGPRLPARFVDAAATVRDDFAIVKGPGGGTTSAEARLVIDLRMEPAQPNPFRNDTQLVYALPERGSVRLSLHDAAGRRIFP